uniref:Uncharacterized protein n=1 Tax=Oryza sativa subsp. japonica TaxID=39947 RepID=Q851W0_ORYSJ|nr:hypothetical protein [Oryza sativa Japonica Group]
MGPRVCEVRGIYLPILPLGQTCGVPDWRAMVKNDQSVTGLTPVTSDWTDNRAPMSHLPPAEWRRGTALAPLKEKLWFSFEAKARVEFRSRLWGWGEDRREVGGGGRGGFPRGLEGWPWAAEDRRWAVDSGGRRGGGGAAAAGMEEGSGPASAAGEKQARGGEGERGRGLAGAVDPFRPAGEAGGGAVGRWRRWWRGIMRVVAACDLNRGRRRGVRVKMTSHPIKKNDQEMDWI